MSIAIKSKFVSDVQYNFVLTEESEIEISMLDYIRIEEFAEEKAKMTVSRKIGFGDQAGSCAVVSYTVFLQASDIETKEQLIEAIRNSVITLGDVYSGISLLISELTRECPVGTIVTPPLYRAQTIEIE